MRSSKSRNRNKPNNNRRPSGNIINRVFDSSGPGFASGDEGGGRRLWFADECGELEFDRRGGGRYFLESSC